MESRQELPFPPERLPTKKEKKENYLFVLGAKDAEMDEIEQILQRHKLKYLYATSGGTRVHPGNAYDADPIRIAEGATLVLVECEPRDFHLFCGELRRIDHHRFGDPGFGKPPKLYWAASSIGQLYTLLGKKQEPSKKHLIIAARDHCRFRVRQCPGVSPREVSNYGRHTIALELGIRRKELDESIQKMQRAIKHAHHIFIGTQAIVDLRRVPVGDVYSLGYMSVYEALADLNQAALVLTRNKDDASEKLALMGAVERETVLHFMSTWGPSEGLCSIYGCEVRGYAGGYYHKRSCMRVA